MPRCSVVAAHLDPAELRRRTAPTPSGTGCAGWRCGWWLVADPSAKWGRWWSSRRGGSAPWFGA
ncbi:MAG: hypothetical protein M3Q10_06870, partial [Chloroflexota bacterium]|nr:hypothetical protein [Chloroflexota bacterium]